ncbi:hypothetical protein Glove_346g181 [Diversispora epigaea]|uniref:Uncharacterized protein n=1 Tax=Diversispora epigaea TaxID=1348612 RepID=A0A397HMM3_9GLOM|nr:hypothetical protein Glove_346g181 [Diversispora epigaea]
MNTDIVLEDKAITLIIDNNCYNRNIKRTRKTTTKEEFRSIGLGLGPARLVDFVKGLSKQKLKSFSSCKTKEDVKKAFTDSKKLSCHSIQNCQN